MKTNIYCLFFLLLQLTFYGQNDSIVKLKPKLSVVSADRMNVVYRGVPNPISIAVPNTKSFTATGVGLTFEKGKYVLKPGVGRKVDIIVSFINYKGEKIKETHTFRIKGLPSPTGLLNDENCGNCLVLLKKEDIKKSIISIKMIGFLMFDFDDSDFFKVTNFDVVLSENKTITVEGNSFSEEASIEINKFKKGDVFVINNIYYGSHCGDCELKRVFPIKVMLEN